jgi:hypothetical protein
MNYKNWICKLLGRHSDEYLKVYWRPQKRVCQYCSSELNFPIRGEHDIERSGCKE